MCSIQLDGGQRIAKCPEQCSLLTNIEARIPPAIQRNCVLRRKNSICSLSHVSGFTFIWDSLGMRSCTAALSLCSTNMHICSHVFTFGGLKFLHTLRRRRKKEETRSNRKRNEKTFASVKRILVRSRKQKKKMFKKSLSDVKEWKQSEVQCNNDPLFPSLFLYFGQEARAERKQCQMAKKKWMEKAREELFSLKMQIVDRPVFLPLRFRSIILLAAAARKRKFSLYDWEIFNKQQDRLMCAQPFEWKLLLANTEFSQTLSIDKTRSVIHTKNVFP